MRKAIAACGFGLAALLASPATAEVTCPGTRLSLKTPSLSAAPYVDLALDRKKGPWLIDYGNTASAVSSTFWTMPAATVELSGFTFPTHPAGKRSYPIKPMGQKPIGVGEARGVVGTDILKTATLEFHYEDANEPYVVVSKPACDPQKVWNRASSVSVKMAFSAPKGRDQTSPTCQ
jgi:hypothetical protein